jgi:competence CoiA-like predicted nuclease
MKDMFFGKDWNFHYGAKKFIKKKQQEYESKLNIYNFPDDINYEISKKLDIYAWLNKPRLQYKDIEDIKKYIDTYVGTQVDTYSRAYIWDKVMVVNNPHYLNT